MKKLIVDASIIIHANYYILTKYSETPTVEEIAEKAIQQIDRIHSRTFSEYDLILALDSEFPFRSDIYDGYKSTRSKKFDKVAVNNILAKRFKSVAHDYLEADDIAYLLSEKYPESVLVSEDKDFLLMLKGGKSLYRPKLNLNIVLSNKDIFIASILKITGGCKSDNVPSIKLKRFGTKFIQKNIQTLQEVNIKSYLNWLQEVGYISNWVENYELVMYDVETYISYIAEFEEFYKSL